MRLPWWVAIAGVLCFAIGIFLHFSCPTSALGWVLFHGAPELLDGAFAGRGGKVSALQRALGPTPFLAAFFAFINVHHYFMDHVIWRRENPATRALRS